MAAGLTRYYAVLARLEVAAAREAVGTYVVRVVVSMAVVSVAVSMVTSLGKVIVGALMVLSADTVETVEAALVVEVLRADLASASSSGGLSTPLRQQVFLNRIMLIPIASLPGSTCQISHRSQGSRQSLFHTGKSNPSCLDG